MRRQLLTVAVVTVSLTLLCVAGNAGDPKGSSNGPHITGVQLQVNRADYKGKCPTNLHFLAEVSTTGPLDIHYRWVSSDGKEWPEKTETARTNGVHDILQSWAITSNKQGWMMFKILSPKAMESSKVNFTVACQ